MQNSFFQKLVLVIIAGAVAALLYQFYRHFVVGGMDAVNPGYRNEQLQRPTPDITPRPY